MPRYIDTHSHIYLEEFDLDRDAAISRAIESGVTKIMLPNIDSTSIERINKTVLAYPGVCYPMMGLHPTSVKDNYTEELHIVEGWLHKEKFSGIGEIGIDLYWDKTYFEQQKAAFITQLEWSVELNLPVIIHARESFNEIIEAIKPFRGKIRGIFHAFSGDLEIARSIIMDGFKIGVGGMVTYKNSLLPGVVHDLELEYIVLETDSPYLTPAPFRGKRNESSYIPVIAQVIAGIKNIPLDEVAEITTSNAEVIFGI